MGGVSTSHSPRWESGWKEGVRRGVSLRERGERRLRTVPDRVDQRLHRQGEDVAPERVLVVELDRAVQLDHGPPVALDWQEVDADQVGDYGGRGRERGRDAPAGRRRGAGPWAG